MPREGGAYSTPCHQLVFDNVGRRVLDHPPQCAIAHNAEDDSGLGGETACANHASPQLDKSHPSNASIDARLPRETSVSSATGSPSPLSRKRLVMG